MIAAQLGLLATQLQPIVLAQDDKQDPGGQGPEFGKAAPIGLVVVLLLLIGTIFLVRSMSRQLRKLPDTFPGYDEASDVRSAGSLTRGTRAAGPATPGRPDLGRPEQADERPAGGT